MWHNIFFLYSMPTFSFRSQTFAHEIHRLQNLYKYFSKSIQSKAIGNIFAIYDIWKDYNVN